MELTEVDTERLGDGDGDERGNAEPWWFEELDDCVSRMAEAERGELAAYSLASCSPDHGLISVLAWLCKCDAMVWQTVAAEAVGLLANQHAAGTGTASDQAFLGLCEALARVPAKTIDSVLMAAVEAE